MSYVSNAADPRRRAAAVASVIAIHAAIGYGLVTGLSYDGVVDLGERLGAVFIPEPPKPPPPDPVEQPAAPDAAPPIAAPVPPLDLAPRAPIEVAVLDNLPTPAPVPIPAPVPLIQPRVQPSFAPKAARPRNDPARWVMTDDYPAHALRNEEEGVTGFAVIVGSDGKVDACEITRSSGSRQLDEATCRNVEKRARFEPATDGSGAKVVGRYTSTVRWQIPR